MDIAHYEEETSGPIKITMNGGGLSLELGDIIRIEAPTNEEYHEQTFYIHYINTDDPESINISIINIANFDKKELRIIDGSYLSDESITDISLLARNPVKGYARQHNLLPDTWIDIHFGGDFPAVVTGQITNLEDDMIEITTYPDINVIYIDFAYRGIPIELPIDEITIREKPASLSPDQNRISEPYSDPADNGDDSDKAKMEYTDTGESIITIPANAKPNENINNVLQQMYLDGDDIFGDDLGDVILEVEVPDNEKRYGIDTQIESLLDGILSDIPIHKRTKNVMDNVHRIVQRFKELRKMYSVFDNTGNIKDIKQLGAHHIPVYDKLLNLNTQVPWLIPVVNHIKRVYSDNQLETDAPDVVNYTMAEVLLEQQAIQKTFSGSETNGEELKYEKMLKDLNTNMATYNTELQNANTLLTSKHVGENIECIVESQPDFVSTARHVYGVDSEDKMKRFSIIRNASVATRPYKVETENGGKIHMKKTSMDSDIANIHSFVMLPKESVLFSKVKLPGTNILVKANLGRKQLELSRVLHKKTRPNIFEIIDLNEKIKYAEDNAKKDKAETADDKTLPHFLNNTLEFSVSPDIYKTSQTYSRVLYNLLPEISTCITFMEKYITDKLSIADAVKVLEPFHIYREDINYSQYNQLRFFIKNKIHAYNGFMKEKEQEYARILPKISRNYDITNIIQEVLTDKKQYLDLLIELYLLDEKKIKNMSSSEMIFYMEKTDGCSLLYSLLSRALSSMYTPNSLLSAFQFPTIEDMSEVDKIRPKDCIRRFLTKKYNSISDLQKDNNTDIFYDKELDDTPYAILKKYDKQKGKMTSDTFVEFLAENLIQKHDCNSKIAKEMAQTLISGKKKVVDGEYAVLEIIIDSVDNLEPKNLSKDELVKLKASGVVRKKTHYYIRKNNNWVRDDSISDEAFIDTQALFCNLENTCYKNTKTNQCDTMERAEKGIVHESNERMLSEMNNRLNMSVAEMEEELEKDINKYKKAVYHTAVLRELYLYKQNTTALNLANAGGDIEEKLTSPYAGVLDMILSLNDFVRQQKDIVWFYTEYCREPLPKEEQGWMYCKETNLKLLPGFLYVLAVEFIEGGDYQYVMDKMCADAELSDDGDYYVDKATGYPIKKRDLVEEDEYDDAGFKLTTHAIMEKDLGEMVVEALAKKVRIFDNATDQMVYNVFMAIVSAAGIPPENIEEATIRTSLELIRNPTVIMEEEKYKQRAAKLEKDTGKTSIVYPIYKNQAILSIVAGVLLVTIQCVIPSIKTRKTFPGCVKSFSGYPLAGGMEDVSGLKYIACLINGIKYDEEPWKSVMKLSAPIIASRIRDVLDKHILKRGDVNELYVKKREYLLLHPDDIIPEEHSIEKWRHFLPPVVEFSVISNLHNVAADFKSHLLETLRKGHKDQFSQLGIATSRISSHTYGIIELIYNIVKNKTSILSTSGGVPFLENACCNDRSKSTHPMTYFVNENPVIRQYLTITAELSKLVDEVRIITKPGILYHEPSTAMVRVEIPTTETERNIYSAVIHYAKFDRSAPVPEGILNICGEKPAGYKPSWSLEEKIEYLKKHGKRYDQQTLAQLMEYIRMKNLIPMPDGEPFNQVVKLMGFLESMELSNSEVVPAPLRELMINAIKAYKPKDMKKDGTVKEIVQLRKYLAKTNEQMLKELINVNKGSFIKSYGNLNIREIKHLQDFMANIHVWHMDTVESDYNGIYTVSQFIKNSVEAMVKVYPSMIMNNAAYTEVHKHWGLSNFHNNDIFRILSSYLKGLNQFKGDKTVRRFLQEIQKKTIDIHLLLQHIPMETPIKKNDTTYFELFDKKTIYYLHVYCWYSVFYEYMNLTSDEDMINIDIQETKRERRGQIAEIANPSNGMTSIFDNSSDEINEAQADLYQVEIQAGEKADLQKRVCEMMIAFLNIDERNKKTLDKPYSEIARRVRRSKEEEKKTITDYLKNMQKDERKVEDLLKQLHQGRWNVGIQKGVFIYDKTTYNNERMGAILRLEQDLAIDNAYDPEQVDVGVDELEREQNRDNDEFYDDEANNIGHFGDDYMDGNYYGEDGDNDFAYDD